MLKYINKIVKYAKKINNFIVAQFGIIKEHFLIHKAQEFNYLKRKYM